MCVNLLAADLICGYSEGVWRWVRLCTAVVEFFISQIFGKERTRGEKEKKTSAKVCQCQSGTFSHPVLSYICPPMIAGTCPPHEWQYLQAEGQNHVRLGQCVLVLLAHVNDRSVVSPFQLLDFELSALGHGHALQVGHQLIDWGLELLDIHGFHVFGHKLGELTSLFGTEKTCDYIPAELMRIYCN